MRVAVLGAGVVGTTAAWYLAQDGHQVMVLDRQAEPALETSHANGGQISVGHPEPWANPTAPLQALRWIGRDDAPLLFRPRADPAQWAWGARFLIECLPWRTRRNSAQAFALARYSQSLLRELRAATGLRYDDLQRGILHFHTVPSLFAHARGEAARLREFGFAAEVVSPARCVEIEPALEHARTRLCGGVYAASDESGDAYQFTQRLAALARERGVAFRFNVSVRAIEVGRGRVERVVIDDEIGIEESVRADAFVVALGSYSTPLLRRVGIRVPVYPVKGYSVTIPLQPGSVAPSVSLTDPARKLVYARLGERLRVAGTAELSGYDTGPNPARWDALTARAFELFPRAGDRRGVQNWCGLRPATPSNQPLIGRTRYRNLYLDTGHGTLGWTMACGSGRALADIVGGRKPEVDFAFLV